MNHAKSNILMSALVALVVLLSACSSTPVTPPPAPAPMKAGAAPAPTAPAVAAADAPRPMAPSSTIATLPAYLDPKSSISTERSVYFDFDKFTVKQDYTAMVERHGKFLASNPGVSIKIEGNTDERGGSEYNLSLGQKRAEALLRALKIYGVKDTQMEAISWGESKPKATGHDEAAWSQNRRDDIQYPVK